MSDVIEQIGAQRVLPVLRSQTPEDAVETAMACVAAGMGVIELTRSIPNVEQAVAHLDKKNVIVGVGTITERNQVYSCAEAGARFVVSFATLPDVIDAAHERSISAIPGALSPTEVLACVNAGADAVKIFPARSVSPDYLRDLSPLIPDTKLIVTGGISPSPTDIQQWLDAGAFAVGMGSGLGTVEAHGPGPIESRCRAALEAAGVAG